MAGSDRHAVHSAATGHGALLASLIVLVFMGVSWQGVVRAVADDICDTYGCTCYDAYGSPTSCDGGWYDDGSYDDGWYDDWSWYDTGTDSSYGYGGCTTPYGYEETSYVEPSYDTGYVEPYYDSGGYVDTTNLVVNADGTYSPAPGYDWATSDPNDLTVVPVAPPPPPAPAFDTTHLVVNADGTYSPAPGYDWATDDPDDLTVVAIATSGMSSSSGASAAAVPAATVPNRTTYLLDALEAAPNDWNGSVAYLQRALAREPENLALRDALAYLKGMHEGHLTAKGFADNRYRTGVWEWMQGRYDRAAENFAAAWRSDPHDTGAMDLYAYLQGQLAAPDSYYCLGDLYLGGGHRCGEIHAMLGGHPAVTAANAAQLQALRSEVAANPGNLRLRAALSYAEGLALWETHAQDAPGGIDEDTLHAALVAMAMGDNDRAADLVGRAYGVADPEQRRRFGYVYMWGQLNGAPGGPGSDGAPWNDRLRHAVDSLDELRQIGDMDCAFFGSGACTAEREVERELYGGFVELLRKAARDPVAAGLEQY